LIERRCEVVRALEAVGARRDAEIRSDTLQFAVRVGGATVAVEWMIGHVEFDHATTQLTQLLALGADFHAGRRERGARGGIPFLAFDFHETDATRAKGLERLGRAQLRDGSACGSGRAHDRRAGGYGDFGSVDRQRDRRAIRGRRTRVVSIDGKHG
jgi:hypothetical protein